MRRRSTTTPAAEQMIAFGLGGQRCEGTALSDDEWRSLARLYGITAVDPVPRPDPPEHPSTAPGWTDRLPYQRRDAEEAHARAMKGWQAWKSPHPMMQAGADRNLFRHASHDGRRMVAWIARYVEPGADPLKVLIELAIGAGWDVDPMDVEYARDDGDGAEDEEQAPL